MDQVFQNFVLHLTSSHDRREIERLLTTTIQDYGLNHFAYVSFPAGGEADTPSVLTTYPASWMARYAENRYDRIDPVIARAVGTMLPFTWTIASFQEPMTRKQKAFTEEAAEAGIRGGLTIPIHDRQGKASTLTLAKFDNEPELQRCIERHQHALHLIALHLHARLRQ